MVLSQSNNNNKEEEGYEEEVEASSTGLNALFWQTSLSDFPPRTTSKHSPAGDDEQISIISFHLFQAPWSLILQP
jgi:hypothetical protein